LLTVDEKKIMKEVDAILAGSGMWEEALTLLRNLLLESGMEETLRWGGPVYRHRGKNVAGILGFKSYAGLWFYQGALLKDEERKLINAQEGVTRALRQWRFRSAGEIRNEASVIRRYVREAMEIAAEGKTVKPPAVELPEIPAMLHAHFREEPSLKESFDSLSPSKQIEYCRYIASARMEQTRISRIFKILPLIRNGQGLHDSYARQKGGTSGL